jgi:hypothetical protein
MNILFKGIYSKIISVFPENDQIGFLRFRLPCLREKNILFTHTVCSYFSASFSHPSYSRAVHSYYIPLLHWPFTHTHSLPPSPFITHTLTPFALTFNAVHSNRRPNSTGIIHSYSVPLLHLLFTFACPLHYMCTLLPASLQLVNYLLNLKILISSFLSQPQLKVSIFSLSPISHTHPPLSSHPPTHLSPCRPPLTPHPPLTPTLFSPPTLLSPQLSSHPNPPFTPPPKTLTLSPSSNRPPSSASPNLL